MFYTGTLGYFAQLIGFNQIGALQANTQYNLSAGYGTFGYEPKVNYTFGLPLSTGPGGVALDIPTNVVIASNNNDKQSEIRYKLRIGLFSSALEHETPELLFNIDPLNQLNGFSAVKGLQIAAAEGQRIYQITKANQITTLPNLNLDELTVAEIRASVNAGKEVITHTNPVSVLGYTGGGYIIIDPITGDGSYKIGGGLNGAMFKFLHDNSTTIGLVALFTGFLFGGTIIASLALITSLLVLQASIVHFNELLGVDNNCWEALRWVFGGVAAAFAFLSLTPLKASGGADKLMVSLSAVIIKGAVGGVVSTKPCNP